MDTLIDQILGFLGQKQEPPPKPIPQPLNPVVSKNMAAPPYSQPIEAVNTRYQAEVFAVQLAAAGTAGDTAVFQVLVRCEFFTLTTINPVGAANDAGVWVENSGIPPVLPNFVAGQVSTSAYWLGVAKVLHIHGGEQRLAMRNAAALPITVIITANTNIPAPY